MLYLNGKIISESDACINPQDRGFLLGDGLFETISCYQGTPFALKQHWERLKKGASFLKLPLPLSYTQLINAIETLLTMNQLEENAGVRITVTRGITPRGTVAVSNSSPTVLITSFPVKRSATPIKVCVNPFPINEHSPLTQFKTLNYLQNILARQQANQLGFDDAILLNTKNHVVSGSAANLFFVKNKILYTPPINDGALPGVTRGLVLELAHELNIEAHECSFGVEELMNADEAFFTNSLVEIQPIASIDNQVQFKTLGSSITKRLQVIYQRQTNLIRLQMA